MSSAPAIESQSSVSFRIPRHAYSGVAEVLSHVQLPETSSVYDLF
jgi:hypothetical protein